MGGGIFVPDINTDTKRDDPFINYPIIGMPPFNGFVCRFRPQG